MNIPEALIRNMSVSEIAKHVAKYIDELSFEAALALKDEINSKMERQDFDLFLVEK